MALKKYIVQNDLPGEGWAIILIDTEHGIFSAVSDFGNYAYMWSSRGREFRQFLIECDASYLSGKLLHGRNLKQTFDGEETKKDIATFLEERHKEDKGWKGYRKEKALLEKTRFNSEFDFYDWLKATSLGDAHDFARYREDSDAASFCERIMPCFKELLKKELEEEVKKLLAHNKPPTRHTGKADDQRQGE